MTLWDLLGHVLPKPRPGPARTKERVRKPPSGRIRRPAVPAAAEREARPAMGLRYEQITRHYLEHHGVKVRRWRTHMSGIATEVKYRDGRVARYIEAPRPKGPMSVAIFLHEIGHHAIGFNTYRPRCLEEYHAWRFAIDHMESLGLNITEGVRRRMHNSLRYAVQKARRRGIKSIPTELHPYMQPWAGTQSGRRRNRG